MKTIKELGVSPAPWSIADFCASHYGVASECGYRTSDTRRIEDARLIAAAPELYEALAAVISWYERNKPLPYEENGVQMIMDYAKKAIVKASGEEDE